MGRLVKNKEMWLREQLRHELRVHIEDLESDPLLRPASAGVAFFLMALLALGPYGFWADRLGALFLSVAFSLVALFALSSRVFVPRHFSLVAGVESAVVGGAAAGALYVLGILISGM